MGCPSCVHCGQSSCQKLAAYQEQLEDAEAREVALFEHLTHYLVDGEGYCHECSEGDAHASGCILADPSPAARVLLAARDVADADAAHVFAQRFAGIRQQATRFRLEAVREVYRKEVEGLAHQADDG